MWIQCSWGGEWEFTPYLIFRHSLCLVFVLLDSNWTLPFHIHSKTNHPYYIIYQPRLRLPNPYPWAYASQSRNLCRNQSIQSSTINLKLDSKFRRQTLKHIVPERKFQWLIPNIIDNNPMFAKYTFWTNMRKRKQSHINVRVSVSRCHNTKSDEFRLKSQSIQQTG